MLERVFNKSLDVSEVFYVAAEIIKYIYIIFLFKTPIF